MEQYYFLIVGIIFVLAFFDIIVGVTNDAVNFMGSAIGSDAAPFWLINLIVSIGILLGVSFSDGMMKLAQNGLFAPAQYSFYEIMIVFVAVMLVDILLLDFLNTLGLPTSTTLALIFELLGGAFAISLIRIFGVQHDFSALNEYLNFGFAIKIVGGIIISIFLAIAFGIVIQFLARLLFSFDIKKNIHILGSFFGTVVITSIVYFTIFKGIEHISFFSKEFLFFLKKNVVLLLASTFGFSLALLFLLSYFKIANVLKVSVLVGTFGMAFAFAGNDLVNFIGVPIAGYESLKIFMSSNDIFTPVTALQRVIPTPSIYLMLAGMVMVSTLWLSSKPKQVIATTLKLSTKNQITEQFSSNYIAREIVRNVLIIMRIITYILPNKATTFIRSRYSGSVVYNNHDDSQSFDTVRAAVNMSVACILISLGTNLNLPLSTTYVVFMVTMGSSIGDGAWNSQNAVYRLSGVITVVSTWFFTAFIAFFLTAFVTFFIYWGGIAAVLILILIVSFFYFKSKIISKKQTNDTVLSDALIYENIEKTQISSIIKNNLFFIFNIYKVVVESIISNERKDSKESLKNAEQIYASANIQKENIEKVISKFEDELEKNYNYLIMIEKLQNASKALLILADSVFKYLDNNHKSLSYQQRDEISQLNNIVTEFTESIYSLFDNYSENKIDEMYEIHSKLNLLLERSRKRQILRIKNQEISVTSKSVYFELIQQTEVIFTNAISVLNIYNMFEDKVTY